MLGLDAAGKTTIVFKLQLGEYISTVPTIGFNVETIQYKNLSMTIWDIGGQKKLRDLWRHYYTGTDAVIYIIDSCDKERLDLAQEELFGVLEDEELRDVPLLIYANKQDMGKITPADITNKFQMEKMRRPWKVQGSCAVTGEGLYEGLDWLSEQQKKRKK